MSVELAELREYSDNPLVKELNGKAIRDKHRDQKKHLALTSITWPPDIEVGKRIAWEVHHTKNGRVSGWRKKKGRIVAINRWHATIDTGRYPDSILLKDLYIGRVRII